LQEHKANRFLQWANFTESKVKQESEENNGTYADNMEYRPRE